jgi:hypothetical protein
MQDPFFERNHVLSGAERLELAIANSSLLPREAETIRTILHHLVAANTVMRDSVMRDDDPDVAQVTAAWTSRLEWCLSELARFGQ